MAGLVLGIGLKLSYEGFVERGNRPAVIRPVDRFTFALGNINRWPPIFITAFIGVIVNLTIGVVHGDELTVTRAVIGGLLGYIGVFLVVAMIASITSSEADERLRPNQGIRDSASNAVRLTSALLICISLLFIGIYVVSDVRTALAYGLAVSLPLFVWGGTMGTSGGFSVMQHIILRQLLQWDYNIPRNLTHFLDHAASLILLRKVGGGYIFIHRYLLEYFAGLDRDSNQP